MNVKTEDHPISQAKSVITVTRWDISHVSALTSRVVEEAVVTVQGQQLASDANKKVISPVIANNQTPEQKSRKKEDVETVSNVSNVSNSLTGISPTFGEVISLACLTTPISLAR